MSPRFRRHVSDQINRKTRNVMNSFVCLSWCCLQLFAFVVSFALMGLTCAFGIAGNYLSVLTLRRDRSLRTSVTKFLLTVLAVADLAFLLPVVVVIMLPAYCEYSKLQLTCAKTIQQAIPWVYTSIIVAYYECQLVWKELRCKHLDNSLANVCPRNLLNCYLGFLIDHGLFHSDRQ